MGLGQLTAGRRGWRGLVEELAERDGVVAGLDPADVDDVGSVEELSADEEVGELGLGLRMTALTPLGVSPCQLGPAMRKVPPSLPKLRVPR